MNFYYLLLKYVLKNPLYIYQSAFLLKTRQLLISIINNSLYSLVALISEVSCGVKRKIDFIIKVLSDTDYYYDKYTQMKDNKIINNIINDKRLKYYFPLMQILLDLKINEIIFNENEINNILERWKLFENIIK